MRGQRCIDYHEKEKRSLIMSKDHNPLNEASLFPPVWLSVYMRVITCHDTDTLPHKSSRWQSLKGERREENLYNKNPHRRPPGKIH